MKAFHCSPVEWEALPEVRRAELIAHEQERNMREAYGMEDLTKAAEVESPISAARRRAGLGPI